MDYDLQLVLRKTEVPSLSLGRADSPTLLGQSSWVIARTPEKDVEDAVLPSGAGPSHHAKASPEVLPA